ncbi:MAG: penicillin-binding protein activator LpoB [Spirochaetia bacterium]|jgi:hypothetical protein|nr:penicillin-binding protein activator LpoB [Spirochaetia bacterium]
MNMRKFYHSALRIFQAALLGLIAAGCSSSAAPREVDQGYFTGSGKDIVIALPLPEGKSLSSAEEYIPLTVRNVLMNDMRNFSDMTVLQPKNEAEIYEEIKRLEESGLYNEKELLDLGNWQNARYALTGSVTKVPPRSYMLDMHITEMESNKILAASTKTGDDLGRTLSDVSAELLAGVNIQLTEKGREALYRRGIQSGTALAQSLMAGRKGSTSFETLHYAYEASYFDPGSMDAVNRVSSVSVALTGNSLEQQLAEYQRWVGLMKECEDFYKKHLPYEIVYDPVLAQTGTTDYSRNTANLEFTIALLRDPAAFKAIETFQRTLRETKKLDTWKDGHLSSGPAIKPEVEVKADLLGTNGKLLGTAQFKLKGLGKAVFRNIKVSDVSDTLTIRIAGVDGRTAVAAGEQGYIKISTIEEFNKNLMPHPLDLVTVIDKTTEITGTDLANVLTSDSIFDIFSTPVIEPYMISRKTITVSQWMAFGAWAKERGFNIDEDTKAAMNVFLKDHPDFASLSPAWHSALPLVATIQDRPVTGISSWGMLAFCNVFSEFYGKPYAYTVSDFFDFSGSSKREVKGGESGFIWGEIENNSGFRRPTTEELRFAHFGGDPELRESSLKENPYSIGEGVRYEEYYRGSYKSVSRRDYSSRETSDVGFRVACSLEEK